MKARSALLWLTLVGCGSVSARPDGGGAGGVGGAGGSAGTTADGATDRAGSDGATSDSLAGDGGCAPESNAQFCARIGKSCESASAADNCGTPRTAVCGTCAATMGCVDGVCKTPVCTTFNYMSATYMPFTRTGIQDFNIAASKNGESLMYAQAAATCGSFTVYLADETTPGSATYTSRDVTAWLNTNNLVLTQGALSGDGLTFVGVTNDGKSMLSAKRSAMQLIDFGTGSPADFATVNGFLAGTAGTFRQPVLSPEGRELYYTINGISTTADGIYRSVRPSGSGVFPLGVRVTVLTSDYEYATAVSSDRLAIFLFKGFNGWIFTRSSTTGEFSNPNAPNPPPSIANWHHKPFENCAKLIAQASPGGCQNEDIDFMYRQ